MRTIATILTLMTIYCSVASAKSASQDENIYTVQKGDSLWKIAKIHYANPLKWKKIAAANKLSHPDLIYPGDVIQFDSVRQVAGEETEPAEEIKPKAVPKSEKVAPPPPQSEPEADSDPDSVINALDLESAPTAEEMAAQRLKDAKAPVVPTVPSHLDGDTRFEIGAQVGWMSVRSMELDNFAKANITSNPSPGLHARLLVPMSKEFSVVADGQVTYLNFVAPTTGQLFNTSQFNADAQAGVRYTPFDTIPVGFSGLIGFDTPLQVQTVANSVFTMAAITAPKIGLNIDYSVIEVSSIKFSAGLGIAERLKAGTGTWATGTSTEFNALIGAETPIGGDHIRAEIYGSDVNFSSTLTNQQNLLFGLRFFYVFINAF